MCECRWVHTVTVSNSSANHLLILSRGTAPTQLCSLTVQILSGKICSAFTNGYKSLANPLTFINSGIICLKGEKKFLLFWKLSFGLMERWWKISYWIFCVCVCPVAKGACWWLAWREATAETLIKTNMVPGVTPTILPFPGTTAM